MYADKALSCGYTGLVMLDGMVDSNWSSDLMALEHPTYYGMMVAEMRPPCSNRTDCSRR